MKREIKFRGLRTDGKGLVYGYIDYNGYNNIVVIHSNDDTTQVIPESVGEFTGLKDRDGVDIYEGDTVNCYGHTGVVTFINGCFVLLSNTIKGKSISKLQGADSEFENIEIIGNIHQK